MLCISDKMDLDADDWRGILASTGTLGALSDARRVAIKPNFAAGTYIHPDSHAVTDCRLLGSLIEFIHAINRNAEILVCEGDSAGPGYAYEKYTHLGLPESLGLSSGAIAMVRLVDLSRDRLRCVKDRRFRYFGSIHGDMWLSEMLLSSDVVVSMCNLKTHSVTAYTGACKNLFGCIPDTDKSRFHPFIDAVVHDLTLALAPQLSIIDAFRGMEGNGPVNGKPVVSGFRIFSDSAAAADRCAATRVGIGAHRVKYLRWLPPSIPYSAEGQCAAQAVVYTRPGLFLRCADRAGLMIQRVGHEIERLGHRVHTASTPGELVVAIVRPLLLRIFGLDTLRRMKRRLLR